MVSKAMVTGLEAQTKVAGLMTSPSTTIGLDVGDRHSQVFGVDEAGEVIEEGRLPTTERALRRRFAGMDPARVVLEVGTHSPWMSRLLSQLGHEVLVANPRAVNRRGEDKNDAIDAESLARWGRSDPRLLRPALQPVLQTIAGLTSTLRDCERTLVRHCRDRYPDTAVMSCCASCWCNAATTCWDPWVPIVIYGGGACSWLRGEARRRRSGRR